MDLWPLSTIGLFEQMTLPFWNQKRMYMYMYAHCTRILVAMKNGERDL